MGEGARGGGRPAMARLEDEMAQLREALSNAENQIRELTRRVSELSRGNAAGQAGSCAERRFGPRDGENLDAWRELGRRMGDDGRPDRPRGPAFADRGPRPGRGPESDFRRGPPRFAGGPPGPGDGFRDGGRFRDGGPRAAGRQLPIVRWVRRAAIDLTQRRRQIEMAARCRTS